MSADKSNLLKSGHCGLNSSGFKDPYHDTTGKRIGWRVTPAVNLGGDDRGKGLRAQSSDLSFPTESN